MKETIQKYLKEILSDRKKTIAAVLIFIVLGFLAWRTLGKKETTPQIQTARVEKGTIISSVTASGTILTSNITHVNSQASGIVKKVYVTNGDSVYTGQIIAEITLDTTGQQNQSQAYASYLSSKSGLASAEANYYTLQSDLFAKNQAFMNGAVASELPENDPTYIQQNDNWLAAEAKFNNYQTDLAKARASYNSSWLAYQETRAVITAPSSGKINSLTIAEGMNLGAAEAASGNRASQRVASILTEGMPLATFNISEIDVSLVKPGQKATVTIDSLPDITFTGKVVSVDRVGTTTSGVVSYPVIIKFDTSSEQVLPNMVASVSIIIESKSDVLLVPSSAVQTQAGQSTVKVLKNGQQETVSVEIGLISDTQTEIVSGLAEGDEVLTGMVTSGQTLQGGGSPFGGLGGGVRIFRGND
jgi:macrolide-specific efflux system membrane fusion protein